MRFRSSPQSISWFRDLHMSGRLTLKPRYQRNPVWMARQKAYLVESILEGLPIPEVFIQIDTDPDGSEDYAVVDGQQRIRAILQFIGADGDPDQTEFDQFALDKLQPESHWYGKAFTDLTDNEKRTFFSYQVSVRLLEDASDDEVKDMFKRLNKFTSPLKPAELRNATYGGPFAALALKYADEYGDFLTENRIVTAESIRRMADIEFFAELIIGALHGPQGGSAANIDQYYQQYEDLETGFPHERQVRKLLPEALQLVAKTMPDLRETRWSNKSDFYTLVVAIASLIKAGRLGVDRADELRSRVTSFAADVEARLNDEEFRASEDVIDYAKAVSRGVNEKSRRVARHTALVNVIVGSQAGEVVA